MEYGMEYGMECGVIFKTMQFKNGCRQLYLKWGGGGGGGANNCIWLKAMARGRVQKGDTKMYIYIMSFNHLNSPLS